MRFTLLSSALLSTLLLATPAAAERFNAGPSDDVEGMINALGPGDELVLADGMYMLSGRFSFSLAGTAAAPIVIRAADGATPHFHRPDASENIWDIDDAGHVVIRGLEFSGGSAGIRISGARDLTIEGCEIHGTGDVALRANDGGVRYERLRFLRNHIHDTNNTGEGMYLGCNENACQIVDSVIEGNWVHHTNADTVSQGDGIELKEGSYGNAIRDNVIHDTNYPCILTYSTVGNGAPNVIERNVLWNCGDHAIQSAADATIRNNIILGSGSDGIAMQPHQNGEPGNLVVVHNTVLHADNDALSVRGAVGPVTIANNALYARGGRALLFRGDAAMLTAAGNVIVGGVEGVPDGYLMGDIGTDLRDGHYMGAPPIDLFPSPGGALPGGGAAAHVVDGDFNGTARMGVADVGAYAFDMAGNPGWILMAGFRDEAPPPRGMDAGLPPLSDGGTRPVDEAGFPPLDAGAMTGGDDDGCGCGVVGRGAPAPWRGLAAGVLTALLVLRRRRSLT